MNLATVPIPVEQGQPVRAKVTSLPDGRWSLAWGHDGGVRVEPFGEPYEHILEAVHDAAELNARADA